MLKNKCKYKYQFDVGNITFCGGVRRQKKSLHNTYILITCFIICVGRVNVKVISKRRKKELDKAGRRYRAQQIREKKRDEVKYLI